MKDKKKKDGSEDIEVIYREDADQRTKTVAAQIQDVFNGPIFAKLVRDAVEEMVLEGKLTYDIDTDEIDIPEDIVRRWAAKMENEVWSKKKVSTGSNK